MRKLGLALALLGAFFWSASAQTSSLSKGDYLLHSIKAVADSGRADDPSYVSALMHLHFTQTSHTVDGMGTYCPAGATESFNTYTTTGDNWFPPPMGKRKMIYANDDDPLFNRISPSPAGTQLTGAYFWDLVLSNPLNAIPLGKAVERSFSSTLISTTKSIALGVVKEMTEYVRQSSSGIFRPTSASALHKSRLPFLKPTHHFLPHQAQRRRWALIHMNIKVQMRT